MRDETLAGINKAIDYLDPDFGVGPPMPDAALATLRGVRDHYDEDRRRSLELPEPGPVRRFLSWLDLKLHLVATDEESAMYDRIDRELREKGQ